MKNSNYKYECTVCGHGFRWSKQSTWFGYSDEKPEAVFCDKKCKNYWLNKNKKR